MAPKKCTDDFAARLREGLRESQRLWAERAQQERNAWLSRPRLHTALFEEVWNDDLARSVFPDVKVIGPGAEERRQKLDQIRKKLGWSRKRLASFQKLIVEYRQSSSAATYLKIRCTFPEIEINVARFAGIDFVFAFADDLKRFQIPEDGVAAALDGDEPSVDALCLRLLALLVERDGLPKGGPGYIERRRSAISDAMVNYLISMILEVYDWHNETFRIPASLVLLIRLQLSGANPDLYEAQRANDKRKLAAILVAERLDVGERLSVRNLAKLIGVSRSTAGRWLAENEFQKDVEKFRRPNRFRQQGRPVHNPKYAKCPMKK